MGLLDILLNRSGSVKPADQNAVGGIFDILNSSKVGGLDGLLGKMTQAGLGNIVNSWISTGKNKSIKSGQLSNILGSEVVGQLATKLGVPHGAAAGMLSKYLPQIVDKLTPDGKVPTTGAAVSLQDLMGKLLK
jgi:uncharacterized protein YidB (DUF937 family)